MSTANRVECTFDNHFCVDILPCSFSGFRLHFTPYLKPDRLYKLIDKYWFCCLVWKHKYILLYTALLQITQFITGIVTFIFVLQSK